MSKLGSLTLNPLDKSFVFAKPIESGSPQLFKSLENEGKLLIQRKRNGHAAFISVTGNGAVKIYSRGINELTEKLPKIVGGVRSLNLPPDTLLAGELYVSQNDFDDLGAFGSIAQSNVARAIELQKEKSVTLSIYNLIFENSVSTVSLPYAERLEKLQSHLTKSDEPDVKIIDVLPYVFETSKFKSLKGGWEGLVLYDKTAGSTFNLDGRKDSPPRPYGCWKWKSYNESDFVVTGWIPSTAKRNAGLVKDLLIAQYNPVSKKLEDWGKVGLGLSMMMRKSLTDNSKYPLVAEIKFETRTKNNRLINAQILRFRNDKKPQECFSPMKVSE